MERLGNLVGDVLAEKAAASAGVAFEQVSLVDKLDGAAELNAERRNSAYATTYAHRRSNRRAQNLDKTERAPAAAGPEALHRVKGMSGRRSRAERCD